ncbi:hypothetical protein TPHA_0D00340 [Tetrapisispora phaffii CBS 4417]|uniref:DUF726 domain-containing protein n=1 Tax=Tetrapisispora phaffii (strain ATCC 24235 / CBS 4417 / NBRC 1672 / NRRL Y-8282 / UCD 70-5) TaxID=1071381 RepID=G8BS57_TETPH|nr:hypothetical protein TPHA_0D00340 [Tetrapisispora phaffii CBS 4417]CCE62678.1 hypothetical protein TPHA_0D00340 [Tetrapisispora phaffii CBS 4417]
MSDSEEDLGITLKGLKIGKKVRNNSTVESGEKLDNPVDNTQSFDDCRYDNDPAFNIGNDHIENELSVGLDSNPFLELFVDTGEVRINDSNDNNENGKIQSELSNVPSRVSVNSDVSVIVSNNALDHDEFGSDENNSDSSDEWQTMPTVASHNIYNNKGELEVKPYKIHSSNSLSQSQQNLSQTQSNDNLNTNESKKGNVFGYTKVGTEDQVQRSYLNNKKTDFLFSHKKLLNSNHSKLSIESPNKVDVHSKFYDEYEYETEELIDVDTNKQLNITKNLLSGNEKIAYAGAINVLTNEMCEELAHLSLCVDIKSHKKLAQRLQYTQKAMAAWKVDVTSRLYKHLEITDVEVKMVEKLSLHGIILEDLVKCLKTTTTIENPFTDDAVISDDDNELEKEGKVTEVDTNDLNSDFKNDDGNKEDVTNDMNDITITESADIKNTSNNSKESINPSPPREIIDAENIKDRELNVDVAWTIICDLFLLQLQNSAYDSRARTLLIKFAKALNITKMEIDEFEKRITDSLDLEQSTEDQVWNEHMHATRRRKKNKKKKLAYVGLAMVGGSLVLGLSGGLLAPVIGAGIAAGLSTMGVTGATGFLTGIGGTATVAVTSTAIGAKIGAQGMSKRMGSVRTFEFRPLHNNRRLNLILSVSGWMIGNVDDVRLPFSTVDPIEGDLYSLYWEPEMLRSVGQTINILASEVFTQTIQQVLGATILTAFMASIQVPMALSKLGYLIDNPWNVSLDRAWAAGLILADTLVARNLGDRPMTLVGFSLGSRVIFSCLVELCKRKAMGIVENVIIFGTPTVKNKEHLVMARSVVSGRFINGYSNIDWVLAYLFRATSGGFRSIMGISKIEGIEGIENFDCSKIVEGHLKYRENIPKLLKALNIPVTSDEFAEIEETMDPEEVSRQRQLMNDVNVAQQKLAADKKNNGWLSGWMKPKKSKWQTMVEQSVEEGRSNTSALASGSTGSKRKDNSLVDHGALMQELANIRSAMNKKNSKDGKPLSEPIDLMELTKPDSQVYRKPPENPNNFSLLSAGRPVLPKDEEMNSNGRNISFSFPDDI